MSVSLSVANLSHQYYGLSLLEYLRRQRLRQELKDLLSQPKHKQLLIQGMGERERGRERERERDYTRLLFLQFYFMFIYVAGIIIASWINPLNDITGETVMKEIEKIAAQVYIIIIIIIIMLLLLLLFCCLLWPLSSLLFCVSFIYFAGGPVFIKA